MWFDRWDVCEAYYWLDTLWGPTPYGIRLHRLRFSLGVCARLESMNENAKAIYGRLVREHHRLYVGYTRYQKRNPRAPMWPGTNNMRSVSEWLRSIGALEAVESMVRE
jgi:hypothetical protein